MVIRTTMYTMLETSEMCIICDICVHVHIKTKTHTLSRAQTTTHTQLHADIMTTMALHMDKHTHIHKRDYAYQHTLALIFVCVQNATHQSSYYMGGNWSMRRSAIKKI